MTRNKGAALQLKQEQETGFVDDIEVGFAPS
jgi:hypothetical protein